MKNTATYSALTEVFRELFRDDTMVLRSEMTASDVAGWDSFKQVEILIATQKRFGFKLRSREIERVTCVGDLDLIERRRAGAPDQAE